MKLVKFTLFVSVIVFAASCRSTTVKGEIFLTNPAGDNQRMAAASITVWKDVDYTAKEADILRAKSEAIRTSLDSLLNCEKEVRRWERLFPDYVKCRVESNKIEREAFLSKLPESSLSVASTTTNANGEFSIDLPEPGRYVIVATASRPDPTGYSLEYVFAQSIDTKNTDEPILSIGNSQLRVNPKSLDVTR